MWTSFYEKNMWWSLITDELFQWKHFINNLMTSDMQQTHMVNFTSSPDLQIGSIGSLVCYHDDALHITITV